MFQSDQDKTSFDMVIFALETALQAASILLFERTYF